MSIELRLCKQKIKSNSFWKNNFDVFKRILIMKKLSLLTLISLMVGLTLNISLTAQVNYYVDPSGTDDGSHGSSPGTGAWQTIQYAVSNVLNPTTATIIINVSGDTYTLNSDDIDIDRSFIN